MVWKECLVIWEDPEDGLIYIFVNVHILLDVKGLLNSKCPWKCLSSPSQATSHLCCPEEWASFTGLWCLGQLRLGRMQSRQSVSACTLFHLYQINASFHFPWENSDLVTALSLLDEVPSQQLAEDVCSVVILAVYHISLCPRIHP